MATQHTHDIRDTGTMAPRSSNAGLWWLVLILGGLAVAFFILLCIWGWGPHTSGSASVAVTQPALLAHPDDYKGKTVTVSGVVDSVFGPRSFTLGGPEFGGQMLVVTQKPLPAVQDRPADAPVKSGDVVQVTGQVHSFNLDQANKQTGANLPAAELKPFEGKPEVMAEQVLLTPRTEAAAAK